MKQVTSTVGKGVVIDITLGHQSDDGYRERNGIRIKFHECRKGTSIQTISVVRKVISLSQISRVMDQFEQQFEDLDVR